MKRLVFATNNKHKLAEARAILGDGLELVALSDIGCTEDIPETSDTLEGNALQKARYVHDHYGVECVADDTGLMVDALGGEPGVLSARYAGPGHDSKANMAKLLGNMQGVTARDAHFSTVLAYVTDSAEHLFEGRVDGSIAEAPDGNDGFGYDPVFIAQETGRTFASMTPAEKNAISHRGRAFKKFFEWLRTAATIILLLVLPSLAPAGAGAAQWRQQLVYDGQADRVIDTPNYTYFLLCKQTYIPLGAVYTIKYGSLYRYDKRNKEWSWLNHDNGLSENTPVEIEYDFRNRLLVVAYDNGNIDLITDRGDKINIPGLKMAGANMPTDVKSISIDGNSDIWVATSTGYVRLDPRKGEVATSRNYGRNIMCVTKWDGKLWVGTEDGLYYGDEQSSDLSSFTKVGDRDKVRKFIHWGSERLGVVSGDWYTRLFFQLTPSADGYSTILCSLGPERSMERGSDGILLSGTSGHQWLDDKGVAHRIRLAVDRTTPYLALGSVNGSDIWVSEYREGIWRADYDYQSQKTTVTMDKYYPNASHAFLCPEMTYNANHGLLVRNHGNQYDFNGALTMFDDQLSVYRDGTWTPLSIPLTASDPDEIYNLRDPMGVAVDPQNPDLIYGGSLTTGFLRLDLKNPENSIRFSRSNDPAAGKPGFITIAEPAAVWNQSCYFAVPCFDSYGILWTMNFNQDNPDAKVYYWMPEDRKATTSWANYRPMRSVTFQGVKITGQSKILPLTYSGHRNIIVIDGGDYRGPITVWDHNATPSDRSDDRLVTVANIYDQDGNEVDYFRFNSIWEDPATGRIWVSCEKGVFHFSVEDFLKGGNTVRRVKVPRNDGTNLADYLLDGAYVTMVTSDPTGQKWFGTLGAGIVVTSEDGREIIKTYTTDNSGLPDNNIYGICHNPDNGSMMISTGKGLVEFFLPSSATEKGSKVRAYPNPVRPEFLGVVTIDGLPQKGMVKIVDAYGNTVKDLGPASGGEVTWDLTGNSGRRVPSAIYYVIGTNGPDLDKFGKMTKILVVN